VAAALALWVAVPAMTGAGLDRLVERWDAHSAALKAQDALALLAVALFLLTPLGMVVLGGLRGLADLPMSVLHAAWRSVLVSLGSAALMLVLALPMALAVVRLGRGVASGILESVGALAIAASSLVIGTGLFILIFPIADPQALALPVTALVNAVMSLPFAMRALVPALRDIEGAYGRLADSLDMRGWVRVRLLLLPRMRRPLGFALGLAAALSMGDLGVIALFADPEVATLPLQLYRLMSAYRMEQAAGAALLLLTLSLGLFWLFDRGGRLRADT
jgi:thiamine transport system permease protein